MISVGQVCVQGMELRMGTDGPFRGRGGLAAWGGGQTGIGPWCP